MFSSLSYGRLKTHAQKIMTIISIKCVNTPRMWLHGDSPPHCCHNLSWIQYCLKAVKIPTLSLSKAIITPNFLNLFRFLEFSKALLRNLPNYNFRCLLAKHRLGRFLFKAPLPLRKWRRNFLHIYCRMPLRKLSQWRPLRHVEIHGRKNIKEVPGHKISIGEKRRHFWETYQTIIFALRSKVRNIWYLKHHYLLGKDEEISFTFTAECLFENFSSEQCRDTNYRLAKGGGTDAQMAFVALWKLVHWLCLHRCQTERDDSLVVFATFSGILRKHQQDKRQGSIKLLHL